MRNFLIFIFLFFINQTIVQSAESLAPSKTIYVSSQSGQRVLFGAKRLMEELQKKWIYHQANCSGL
ncbi:hypothetical protein [Pedobacter agri]|uniref:hypothetical protein n=1 Tax=Pedobacter agri TaxID=454586 RepID=UPI00029AB5BF|nr:hypothetical protein [Pedobacter agri]